ncbi:MAG: hypothetical protein U0V48_12120 [Anaerolineales bacterium]
MDQSDARMKVYEHFVNDLFRKQAHVRSAEVEELMGMLRDPFGTVRNTASLLANADFKFKPAKNSKGKKVELTQSTFDAITQRIRPQSAADRVGEITTTNISKRRTRCRAISPLRSKPTCST